MNRRQFFKTLLGMVAAAFGVKRLPVAPQGIGIRIIHTYSGGATRLDVLYGFATLRPEYACKVVG